MSFSILLLYGSIFANSTDRNKVISKHFTLIRFYDIMGHKKGITAMTIKDSARLMFAETFESVPETKPFDKFRVPDSEK